jgi:hypothetical protein
VAVVDLSRAPDAATLAAVRGIEATLGAFLALANAP